jgi:probable F420-dependent oxidoreductase
MARFRVGYQIHPQHCSTDQIREAYRNAESLGVDVIYVWDHMHPLYGDPEGINYASTPILGAIAAETKRAQFGTLVSAVGYRNPEFYAYEVWTLNRLSHGRAILGIGAGWFEHDYEEYGYEFGNAPYRLRELGKALPRIKERLRKLGGAHGDGNIPIMIGGAGEKVTLKLAAKYADLWNTFPPLDTWRRKNEILTEWCVKVGRDPRAIERTCSLTAGEYQDLDGLLEAGAQQLILRGVQPFTTKPLEELLKLAGK